MTRASLSKDRLGPYVFAFVAGAIALASTAQARKAERDQAEENAKARAALVDKLLDRFAAAYRVRA